jgi:response regulator RpfG family c-di-GMP phosphodiesterase
MITDFIIVDDDMVNNLICRKNIKKVFPEANISEFTEPETALVYIRSVFSKANAAETILFLDINMPTMSGWDFLQAFERFDVIIRERLRIYMLSSSVAEKDLDAAAKNKNVSGYIEKPLDMQTIAGLQKNIQSAA